MPSRTSQVRLRPCAVVLEHVDDAQALLVVLEAAGHRASSSTRSPAWPNGVCPRSWPSAMASVSSSWSAQHLGDRPGDLRHLERVRQARPVVIAGRREEDLRLVLEPAERLAVDDAVAVALERRPDVVLGLRAQAPARVARCCAACGARDSPLARFELLADRRSWSAASGSRQEAAAVRRAGRRRRRRRASGRGRRTSSACRGRRPAARAGRTPAAARTRASGRCSASSGRCRGRR